MHNIAIKTNNANGHVVAVEAIARETELPVEQVEALYRIERSELEQVARITTFVPVLTSRRVRMKLRASTGKSAA